MLYLSHTADKECGIPINTDPTSDDRIIGGKETCSGCIPWQVALILKEKVDGKTKSVCGGTILSSRFVLTAAHCFYNGSLPGSLVAPKHLIQILAGATNLDDPVATRHDIAQLYQHKMYNHGYGFSHDFTMLKLKDEINLSPAHLARAVCLPKPDVVFDSNTEFLASGWGKVERGNQTSVRNLKDTKLQFVQPDECQSKWKDFEDEKIRPLLPPGTPYLFRIDSSMICAGRDNSDTTSCDGDSGGKSSLASSTELYWLGTKVT